MSFLSILFFVSAFYVAHARPDWTTGWGFAPASSDNSTANAEVPAVPKVSTAPEVTSVPKEPLVPEQMGGFMKEMSSSFDRYMTPIMSKMDVTKQNKLKTMGLNGFASYINYLLLLIEEEKAKDANHDDDDDEDFNSSLLGRDDIILEFEALDPFDLYSPFITEVHTDELHQN